MDNPKNFQHHEQGLSSQKSFQKQSMPFLQASGKRVVHFRMILMIW